MREKSALPEILRQLMPGLAGAAADAWTETACGIMSACGGPETFEKNPIRAMRLAHAAFLLLMVRKMESRLLENLEQEDAELPPAALLRQVMAMYREANGLLEKLAEVQGPEPQGAKKDGVASAEDGQAVSEVSRCAAGTPPAEKASESHHSGPLAAPRSSADKTRGDTRPPARAVSAGLTREAMLAAARQHCLNRTVVPRSAPNG
ncbi:MAG TPA: hypothetical protein PLO53_00075 [Candidatus Hydrogenedentes bacterium]|nr:hypothetical protein [Candidatus Hydrogenedentota bacterium]HPU96339.1 hypothetical protein [Candidatus Hydrogenedentota bacterium]